MTPTNDILKKAGGETGYTVPENYFHEVRLKILADLPEYPAEQPQTLSKWQRIKPYIYMAAMFAGIWCMMKMFHMMSTSDMSLDNPPEAVAMAMADSNHYEWMDVVSDDSDSFQIEDDLCTQYATIEEFKADFNSSEI